MRRGNRRPHWCLRQSNGDLGNDKAANSGFGKRLTPFQSAKLAFSNDREWSTIRFRADREPKKLAAGTAFTAISNASASSISGTFANLADGATFTAECNTFQASYTGGNGIDLTLPVAL